MKQAFKKSREIWDFAKNVFDLHDNDDPLYFAKAIKVMNYE